VSWGAQLIGHPKRAACWRATEETPNGHPRAFVVGAGNAATCAALSARENGASVLMLEIAPEHWRGGNSAFAGGAWRIIYRGFGDLARRSQLDAGTECCRLGRKIRPGRVDSRIFCLIFSH
jgi:glycine/D-amino acid oxidase-like deaminating enzyme